GGGGGGGGGDGGGGGGGGGGGTNPLVDNIINNSNIAIASDSTGDCLDVSGNRVGPQTTINQADHNQPLTVCSAGCTGKSVCAALDAGPRLNQNMLNATAAAANAGNSFTIVSLTTGDHASNSQHYMGNAEDLAPKDHSSASFEKLRKFFSDNQQLYNVDKVFCENKSGIASCTSSGITHVHVQFKR
ncbi:hypothetical protein KGQ34_04155, partial [Patescibacteria group bacterium]|nr:hypothetical protein [Patescibacteria group bacterium]